MNHGLGRFVSDLQNIERKPGWLNGRLDKDFVSKWSTSDSQLRQTWAVISSTDSTKQLISLSSLEHSRIISSSFFRAGLLSIPEIKYNVHFKKYVQKNAEFSAVHYSSLHVTWSFRNHSPCASTIPSATSDTISIQPPISAWHDFRVDKVDCTELRDIFEIYYCIGGKSISKPQTQHALKRPFKGTVHQIKDIFLHPRVL